MESSMAIKKNQIDLDTHSDNRAFDWILEELNNPFISSLNIDRQLRQPLREIIKSLNRNYGPSINWGKFSRLLKNSSISVMQKNPDQLIYNKVRIAGEFKVVVYSDCNNIPSVHPQITILEDTDSLMLTYLSHETTHLASTNEFPTPLPEKFCYKVNIGFCPTYTPAFIAANLGQAINEGVAVYISSNISKEILGINKIDECDYYDPLCNIAEQIHGKMGDLLIYSFFEGQPSIAENEFNRGMSKGSWHRFISLLDKVLIAQKKNSKFTNINSLQKKSNTILKKYLISLPEQDVLKTLRLPKKLLQNVRNLGKSALANLRGL